MVSTEHFVQNAKILTGVAQKPKQPVAIQTAQEAIHLQGKEMAQVGKEKKLVMLMHGKVLKNH